MLSNANLLVSVEGQRKDHEDFALESTEKLEKAECQV